jgi:translocator protein
VSGAESGYRSEQNPSPWQALLGLLFWLALCFAVAWFGAQFQPGDWYRELAKPSFTPPGWLFGPVWTVLYATMGVAAWLVWRDYGFAGAPAALGLFVIQLGLNGLWSFVFFGLQRPALAFLELVLLWLTILATLKAFWRHKPPAGWLLLPYLLWVSFAALLNFAIWRLNA